MVASVTVITGPARSGKTHRLLSHYRAVLMPGKPGTVLWLAPSWRAAADVRSRILGGELEACWEPGIFTFDKFAQAVLEATSEPIRLLSRSMKRRLVRHLIDEQYAQGRLRHFRPIVATGGLVDLVSELIGELKRLEIWPEDFRRACQARGFTAKDRELLELYDAYQLILRENRLYDAEGRFWSARDRLQQGQRRPFENLRLAVVDGFTDFTRTQHEILEQLAVWVDEIIISLPLESEPYRSDLFSKPLKTLKELQRRHRNLSVEELPRRENPAWPAMDHLERRLFINPRRVQTAQSTVGVEILAAAKVQGEMELVGARIKRLLAEEIARPGDIAVVFRSPQDSGGLAAEVFYRLGIPIAWEKGRTLDRVPVMRALTAILQLDLDDWPFRQLLTVLGSNYFQPDWPDWQGGKAASAAERTLRKLHIPHGRTMLLDQVNGPHPNPLPKREGINDRSLPKGEGTIEIDLNKNPTSAILNRLASVFDELPAKATLPQWAKAWEKLARETGLLPLGDQIPLVSTQSAGTGKKAPQAHGSQSVGLNDNQDSTSQDDIIAWNRLIAALSAGDTLFRHLNRRPPELDRGEAYRALKDILGSERMPVVEDESGRVRVLSAASVRSLEIPYLFLAGLSEKAFPPPDREDRLYSEADYAQLIERGLPLVARTERMCEEMLLFYEALTRATHRLYLSYPGLDAAAGPLSPSPYLLEVEQACGGDILALPEITDIRPIPAGNEPLSAAWFRVKALDEVLSGDVSLFAGLLQNDSELKSHGATELNCVRDGLEIRPAKNILAGLEMILLRQDRDCFGPAEGMLLGKAVHKLLANDYSSKRCFSASELELYAACPYRFLLENILKVSPPEDISLQLDALERGQIVHDVLASFHRQVNETAGHPASPLEFDEEQYDRLMKKAMDETFTQTSSNPVLASLREINRRLITKWLAEYRRQHENYDKLWSSYEAPLVPEFFEVSFGESKHRQEGLSIDAALEFYDGKDTVRVSGRIDRIDTGKVAGQEIFNVLDYKTGGTRKYSHDEAALGTSLQLPLYAMAVAELVLNDRDIVPWQAGYWSISREDGFKSKQSLIMYHLTDNCATLTDEWETSRAALQETISTLVKGIRRGDFPVFNRDRRCTSYCPLRTVCRIGQIRSLEKTWTPRP